MVAQLPENVNASQSILPVLQTQQDCLRSISLLGLSSANVPCPQINAWYQQQHMDSLTDNSQCEIQPMTDDGECKRRQQGLIAR